jgi:hypothetical protein
MRDAVGRVNRPLAAFGIGERVSVPCAFHGWAVECYVARVIRESGC